MNTPSPSRSPRTSVRVVAVVVCWLVVAAVATTVGGAAAGAPGSADVAGPTSAPQVAPTNGTAAGDGDAGATTAVVRHVDPDEVDDPRNLGRVENYLLSALAGRLSDGAVRVERGRYGAARDAVGDDYDDLLARYVTLTGEPDGGEVGRRLAGARDETRSFAAAVDDYERTYAAYEAAAATGDATETRRIARELERDAARASTARDGFVANATAVENATGAPLADARRSVEAVGTDVETRQAAVRAAEFEPTTVVVDAHDPSGSYLDPIRVTGRVTLADAPAAPVDDPGATFAVGGRLIATPVANGTFDLSYRPTAVPSGPGDVTVVYRPSAASAYLDARTSIEATVEPVTATLSVDSVPTAVAYGDRVVVAGRLTADDGDGDGAVPVSGVPLVATLAGRPLAGETTTDVDGRVRFDAPLPASIAAGERVLSVGVAGPGRAVRADAVSRAVTVEVTPTTAEIGRADAVDGRLVVRGRLATASGDPLPGTTVQLRADGSAVASLRTDADGRFGVDADLASTVPAWDPDGNSPLRLVAAFDATGTSLASATSAPATIPGSGTATRTGRLDALAVDDLLALVPAAVGRTDVAVALGAAVAVAGSVLAVRSRRRRPEGRVVTPRSDGGGSTVVAAAADGTDRRLDADEDADAPPTTLLADARVALDAGGTATATRLAYRAARAAVATAVDVPDRGTPREFLAAAEATGAPPATTTDLGTLTRAFERTAFASRSVDAEAARATVDLAAAVVDRTGTDGRRSGG